MQNATTVDYHGQYIDPQSIFHTFDFVGDHSAPSSTLLTSSGPASPQQPPHTSNSGQLIDNEPEMLPRIYEQTTSEGGYTDLQLLADPQMDALLNSVNLSLHTQHNSLPHSPYGSPLNLSNGSHHLLDSSEEDLHKKEYPPPLNLDDLRASLTAPQGASLTTPSPELTPNSDHWETSSYYDLATGEDSIGGGSPSSSLHPSNSQLRRRAASCGGNDGKEYRRTIEKRSRDKKTQSYMRLRAELEALSSKKYDSRSQAEVFEEAAQILSLKIRENQRLKLENEALRDRLKSYGLWTEGS